MITIRKDMYKEFVKNHEKLGFVERDEYFYAIINSYTYLYVDKDTGVVWQEIRFKAVDPTKEAIAAIRGLKQYIYR